MNTTASANPHPVFRSVVKSLRCKKCNREFVHIHVVTIEGVDNLMISGAKVFRLELVCAQCGTVNYWNQREREMAEQTEVFVEVLAILHGKQTVE